MRESVVIDLLLSIGISVILGIIVAIVFFKIKEGKEEKSSDNQLIEENEFKFLHTMRVLGVEGDPVDYVIRNTEQGNFEWQPSADPDQTEFRLKILDGINLLATRSLHVFEFEYKRMFYFLLLWDDKNRFESANFGYIDRLSDLEMASCGDERIKKLLDILEKKYKKEKGLSEVGGQ